MLPAMLILLQAVEAKPTPERKARELLDRASAMVAAAKPEVQVAALMHIGDTYQKLDRAKGAELTAEVFERALATDPKQRGDTVARIVTMVAEVDIDRAAAMAHRMPPDAEDRARAIERVVGRLAAEGRIDAGLALLESAAGHPPYPFAAARMLLAKIPPNDPRHYQVFAAAYAAFDSKSPHDQFAEMLAAHYKSLPPDAVGSAAKRLVEVAEAAGREEAKRGEDWVGNFSSSKGAVQFHNRLDAQLFRVYPVVAEVDPKRAKELLESRPELRAAIGRFPGGLAELASAGSLSSNVSSGSGQLGRAAGMAANAVSEGRVMEAEQAMRDGKFERAVEIARDIPDVAARARVLGSVAAAAGEKDPVRGQSLLAAARKLLEETKDKPGDRFQTWLDIARASMVMKDDAGAWSALDKALADAHDSLKQDADKDSPNEATHDYWPSTQRYRRCAHLAAKLFGVDADPLLSKIVDPEASLLATVEMARGLLGLSSRTNQTNVSRSK